MNPTILIEINPNYSFDSIIESIPHEPNMVLSLSRVKPEKIEFIRVITDKASEFYDSLTVDVNYSSDKIQIKSDIPNETLFFVVQLCSNIDKMNYDSEPELDSDINFDSSDNQILKVFSFCYLPGVYGHKTTRIPVEFEDIDYTSEYFCESDDGDQYVLSLRNNEKFKFESKEKINNVFDIYKYSESYYFEFDTDEKTIIKKFIIDHDENNVALLRETKTFCFLTPPEGFIKIINDEPFFFTYEYQGENSCILVIESNGKLFKVLINKNICAFKIFVWNDYYGNNHIVIWDSSLFLVNIELTQRITIFDQCNHNYICNDGILIANGTLNGFESKGCYYLRSPKDVVKFYRHPSIKNINLNEIGNPEWLIWIQKNSIQVGNDYGETFLIKKEVGHSRLWFLCLLLFI